MKVLVGLVGRVLVEEGEDFRPLKRVIYSLAGEREAKALHIEQHSATASIVDSLLAWVNLRDQNTEHAGWPRSASAHHVNGSSFSEKLPERESGRAKQEIREF
jgi:hypothetical protein